MDCAIVSTPYVTGAQTGAIGSKKHGDKILLGLSLAGFDPLPLTRSRHEQTHSALTFAALMIGRHFCNSDRCGAASVSGSAARAGERQAQSSQVCVRGAWV